MSDYDLLPKLFVLNGTVKATGTSADLTAGDFGLYNAASNVVVTTGNVASHPNAYIAQGSFYASDKLGNVHGGFKESIKSPAASKGINPKNVKKWYKVAPRAGAKQKVRLFWDGSTAGAGPSFFCGKTYRLRLEAKGEPVLRYINRQIYKQFAAFTGCCAGDCNAGCTDAVVDGGAVLLDFATQINRDPIFNNFVSAQAFVKTAATTITTTSASTAATVASGTGIVVGQKVIAAGIAEGTTVAAVAGTSVTLSIAATATGATVPVTFSTFLTSSYVSPTTDAAKAAVVAGLDITVIYTATSFADCSFNQGDFYDEGFVEIMASVVDQYDNPCDSGEVVLNSITGTNFTIVSDFTTPAGSGEKVLREFIASQTQSGIFFSHDPRSREVSGNIAMTAVSRAATYTRYYLEYSVAQTGNPSNANSQDQYILCFVVKTGDSATAFEALMLAWLQAHNPSMVLETIV
jgi:hypothetical protein